MDGYTRAGPSILTTFPEVEEAALKTAQSLVLVPMNDMGIQIELHAGGADVEIDIGPDGIVRGVFWAKPG